jgi:beta-lactamase regulating signal transducer with metallopeptidase domain
MNAILANPAVSAVVWVALKASAILALAVLLDLGLRRRASAAARHASWTLALAAVLLLPALSLTLPKWGIAVAGPTPVASVPASREGIGPADPATGQTAPRSTSTSPAPTLTLPDGSTRTSPSLLFTVYLLGVVAVLGYVMLERYRLGRLLRHAHDETDTVWMGLLRDAAGSIGVRRPVRLLRSRVGTMPMTAGTCRPAIVIPAIAETWPEDRRRAVLLHELAHVARFDCLTQLLAHAACAIYWFHPLAWWAANRLRLEREHACDDRVIAAGAPAREYAGHLLEIAYSFGPRQAPAVAVGMARSRQLEGRLLAVLDAARNRRVPARRARIAAAALAAVMIVPLAAVTVSVAAPEAPVASRVESDQPAAVATDRTVPEIGPQLHSTADLVRSTARRAIRDFAAAFGLAASQQSGTWEIRPAKSDGTVHLRLVEGDSSWGRNIRLEQLEGLTASQLSAGGPVQFKLRRDAGTFTFDGVVRAGVGAGTFSFAPDPAFAAGLEKRGYARPTASQQYALARADVGYAFLDELTKQGYARPTTAELVRAGEHGVHTDYLREMGTLGYRLGTLSPLIELRDHGVGPDYIRALAEQGYKGLGADELLRARDHGVSPEYVAAMREAGYGSLPMAQLVNARDHGVSADYVRAMAAAGYTKLPLDALVRARDHGVSGDYAAGMRALGFEVALEDLVRARDHGVSVEFVRELTALGYTGQPIDALVRLRDHGVTTAFVKELKALGYDGLPVDDLVRLRDHGVNAERIRSANARAGTRLPVDLLLRLDR